MFPLGSWDPPCPGSEAGSTPAAGGLLRRAYVPAQDMVEVHRASGAQRERSASMSAAARAGTPGVEAVPNSGAPLLRDERARREWLEHELDMCCQVRNPTFDPRPTSAAAFWTGTHSCRVRHAPMLAVLASASLAMRQEG